jgi:hypothetical protein
MACECHDEGQAVHADAPGQSRSVLGYGRITTALLDGSFPFARYIGIEISEGPHRAPHPGFTDPRMTFMRADILSGPAAVRADLVFGSAVFEHFYPDMSAACRTSERC